MGLIKDRITKSGLEVKNAYHRIRTMIIVDGECNFTLDCYKSRMAFLQGMSVVLSESKSCKLDITDGALNYTRQVYAHLKKTEEFQYAEDVLEQGQSPLINSTR